MLQKLKRRRGSRDLDLPGGGGEVAWLRAVAEQ